ncbi:unnamed protein product [Didymodactylos carnosus]|uniref:Uncharacterized protein n=1 Tax=Didymodactylos carnosus TaxID=1234261 RepID=A0A816B6T9_9BILA|nr:unnamed protein product [Didymodactylos carnosus]CAF1605029.1 unnamed protein product [Didymodactylos carnosus]CAF3805624.1 unnamed protein product [Didymodactylos carnosus]CAF4484290.1 unnamed protein product [Didymodactylos carnosus]
MDGTDDKDESWRNDCSYQERMFDCDEHLCSNDLWSYGEGECINGHGHFVYQPCLVRDDECRCMREYNYQCETSTRYQQWTLPNGL